jgi:hypothetical protein
MCEWRGTPVTPAHVLMREGNALKRKASQIPKFMMVDMAHHEFRIDISETLQ